METISTQGLNKHFGKVKAINDVSFHVSKGEVVGFLGPNGAGKSTTMKVLCGLMSASSGKAYICGIPVSIRPDEVKRKIGYMPENNPLPDEMRVIEYLRYRASLKEIPKKERKEAIDYVMEVCDLHHKAAKKIIGTLSKGFRQRVGIADAILAKPEVVIMDEPTIGLDPHQVIGIRELIDGLRGKMTIILSSHILSEIELCCDRVIIINHGRIVAQGSTSELRKEFIPSVRYKLLIQSDRKELEKTISEIDTELNLISYGDPSIDMFREVVLETTDTKNLGETLVSKLVKEHNLKVRDITRLEPGLENIFLAATRKSWRETQNSSSAVTSIE